MPEPGGETKRYIEMEVKRQLEPTHTLLEALKTGVQGMKEWQLSFWSNGSGRPPGFFQSRIQSDDLRYKQLDDETKRQSGTLGELHDFMVQQKASRLAREEAEHKHAELMRRFWAVSKWVAGILGPILLAAVIWLGHQAAPVLKILWGDYLKTHPYVTEQLKNRSYLQGDSELSYSQKSKQVATE